MERQILLVEDSRADALVVQRRLREADAWGERWILDHVAALAPAFDRLGKGDVDLVLLDLGLPDSSGLATLVRLREREPRVPIVVLTGTADEALGIRALEGGAQDYLVKGEVACARTLVRSMRHAIERSRAAELRVALAARVAEAQRMESLGVVAASAGRAYDRILERILSEVDACFASKWRVGSAIRRRLAAIRRAALEGELLGERLSCYAAVGQAAPRKGDLSHFVLETFDLLDPLLGASVELDLDLAEHLPRVSIDPVSLRQLLVALVLNGADAIGAGSRGCVRIRTAREFVGQEVLARCHGGAGLRPGGYVTLRVCDTGCGFSPGEEVRSFDPFYSGRDGARGLGLSAALGIARQHGGAIRIEAREPRGSSVCVLLPTLDTPPSR